MRYLVDTNVLLRWSNASTTDHNLCTKAIDSLVRDKNDLCICAQVLIEYRVVATRPLSVNGFGLGSDDVRRYMSDLREIFTVLPELPDIAERWEDIVDRYAVLGRQAHDARLVAIMLGHGIRDLITFNTRDFEKYSELNVHKPADMT